VAELLRQGGYRTGVAGKWHVTPVSDSKHNWPLQRGFESYFGIIYSVRSYFDPPTLTLGNESIKAGDGFYLTEAITDNAVKQLTEFSKGDKPFFLYVAYTAPHWPLHALPEDVKRYRDRYRDGWDELRTKRHARQLELGLVEKRWGLCPRDPEVPAWADVKHKEWQAERMAVYAAMVDRLDQGVGRILTALREAKRDENTLVLFLSDNGGCAEDILPEWRGERFPNQTRDGKTTKVGNDPAVMPGPAEVFQSYGRPWAHASNVPFRLYKHWVHEGGISTPCIAWWPGVIRKPGLLREPAHVIDILPTCLDVAGLTHPKTWKDKPILPPEGKSLRPLFEGKPWAGHEGLFWEHEGNRAVQAGGWKLVAEHKGPWELYNLANDRIESSNLAEMEPARVKLLAALYQRWADRVGVVEWDKLKHPSGTPK
jgi:arylsulfatase